jgi:hypothetical protein
MERLNKQLLRMQRLAGVITENEFIKLLENASIVNNILDKISSKGINSLTPEEKNYLDNYSKGKKDLIEPTSGETKTYISDPYVELYKIENFPAIPNSIKRVDFNCDDAISQESCENYNEMQELFKKSPKLKIILDKINKKAYGENNGYFHGIDFQGNFSSPLKLAYVQLSGDGFLYFVDSLFEFDEDYQTEEDWGVKSWKEI